MKQSRIEYGNGAWCEIAERDKRTFMGFTLRKNQVFGRDEKSPYIVTNLVADSSGERGIHSDLLIYRFDPCHGWVQVWQPKSKTTVYAIVMYRMHNPYARITRESRESHVNPLQEVKGQKYYQLLT